MKFSCEQCKNVFSKSTKYHRCSKCGGKLQYECPTCFVVFGANYQIHLKKCKKKPILDDEIQILSYKYGKEKIIAVTNVGEITVAYYCEAQKKIYFGKERAKKYVTFIY